MSCRLNIILDLDNTLIHSFPYDDTKVIPPTAMSKFRRQKWKNENIITFERPHLQRFLSYLFSHFNVGVFTLGTEEYASEIVRRFIQCVPGRKLDFVLHRGNVMHSALLYPGTLKDLRYIWSEIRPFGYLKCNTFIVDDSFYVQQTNPQNAFWIEPFEVIRSLPRSVQYNNSAVHDSALLTLIQILNELKRVYYTNECAIHSNNKKACHQLHATLLRKMPRRIYASGLYD